MPVPHQTSFRKSRGLAAVLAMCWIACVAGLGLVLLPAASPSFAAADGMQAPTPLKAGPQKLALPTSGTTATFEFVNNTGKEVYDLLLSTQESSWIDPDFEGGPVTVSRPAPPPVGVNLGWITTPAPADGVEDIKVMVPGIDTMTVPNMGDAIQPGEVFTLDFTSTDGFSSGDWLTVTPTTLSTIGPLHRGVQIVEGSATPHSGVQSYPFFNGYDNLPGELSGKWAGTSGLAVPVENVGFSSLSVGVQVVLASSSLPHTFDPVTSVLTFQPPISPGAAFDYLVDLNGTEPFVESDPSPYTEVEAALNVAVAPSLSISGLMGGGNTTITASHCTPGGKVRHGYSLAGGGPVSTPFGNLLLSPPYAELPFMTINGSGTGSFSGPVPPGTTGISVWFHALDLGSLTFTNGLAEIIG